jgi:hypothetical protein
MRILFTLAAGWALLFLTPDAHAEEFTFDSNGVEIFYQVEGSGEPVVLIHGYTVTGNISWRMSGVIPHLSDKYQVIVPDVRGHGKSGKPPLGQYGMESVRDIIRLLDKLDIKEAHIVGYSMGGSMAIKLATDYPKRVKSVVIAGSGWRAPGTVKTRELKDGDGSSTLDHIFDGFPDFETTADQMRALKMPLTVIVGEKDDGAINLVKPWQAITPNIPVVYIKDSNHMSAAFKPSFRETVRTFLDSQSGK